MTSRARSFWKCMESGARSTSWALLLLTPIVYYRLGGKSNGILFGIAIAAIPLLLTFGYLLLWFLGWHRRDHAVPVSMSDKVASFFAASLPFFTAACLYNSRVLPTTWRIMVLWAATGISVGLFCLPSWSPGKILGHTKNSIRSIWSHSRKSEDQKLMNQFLLSYIAGAIIQSTLKFKRLGNAGSGIGFIMVIALGVGFVLRYLVQNLWQSWQKCGKIYPPMLGRWLLA